MKNKKIDLRSEAGFTLMELIVVIAIIAILIGLLLPQFNGMTDKANAVSAKSDARSALTALASYTTSVANNPKVKFDPAKAEIKMINTLGLTGTTLDSNDGYKFTNNMQMVGGGTTAVIGIVKGGLTYSATLNTLLGKVTDFTCAGDKTRCEDLVDEGIVTGYTAP